MEGLLIVIPPGLKVATSQIVRGMKAKWLHREFFLRVQEKKDLY